MRWTGGRNLEVLFKSQAKRSCDVGAELPQTQTNRAKLKETSIMSNQETPNRMARIGRGRLALLASVASIGLVVAAAGTVPKGSVPAYISAAQADGASQHSQGFADLVDKVKPAVISVRVNLAG